MHNTIEKPQTGILPVLALVAGLALAGADAALAKGKPDKQAKGVSFGPEYYLQPSSSGAINSRNVVVLKGDRGGFGGCNEEVYLARVYFDNTEGLQVKNAGGVVTPDEIFAFGFVCAQRGTSNVIYQSEYKYAFPDDPNSPNPRGAWESALGMEINQDFTGDGIFNQQDAYDYALTYRPDDDVSKRSELVVAQEVEIFRDGNQVLVANNFSSETTNYPAPLEIAPLGETFADVIMATHGSYGAGGWIRFHAKGIGQVQLIRDNANISDPTFNLQTSFEAIYYRVEGAGSNGSLAGTPFESGGASEGLWFLP